jgi:hypothetical protein
MAPERLPDATDGAGNPAPVRVATPEHKAALLDGTLPAAASAVPSAPIADSRAVAKAELLDGSRPLAEARGSVADPALNRKADLLLERWDGVEPQPSTAPERPSARDENPAGLRNRPAVSESAAIDAVTNVLDASPAARDNSALSPDAPRVVRDSAATRWSAEVTDMLRRAGVDPPTVWGDRPPGDPDRQRAEHVVANTRFPKAVEGRMVEVAARFACAEGGRDNPRMFANLYEYVSAYFGDERLAATLTGATKANAVQQAATRMEQNPGTIHDRLRSDRIEADSVGRGPVFLGDDLPANRIPDAVRSCADALGFRDSTAAAYHARKHSPELPSTPTGEIDPVKNYLEAMSNVVKQGRLVSNEVEHGADGRTRLIYHQENDVNTLEVIVFVSPENFATVATFGGRKAANKSTGG